MLQIQGWLSGLLQMTVLGAAFAHLMLLRARHRLQAFNLLLPVAGLITAGPLILFSWGAQRVRLSTLGIAGYLNPSIQMYSA